MFEDPKNLLYAVALIVPGYVWARTEARVVVQSYFNRGEWTDKLVAYVVYTLLASVPWAWLLPHLVRDTGLESLTLSKLGLWALVLLAFPVICGLVTGCAKRYDWFGRALSKVNIQTIHPVESAWDFAFGRPKECLVRVKLKSGEELFGWYGRSSLTSSDAEERDIFLQQVWIDENGRLSPQKGSLGIWVARDEISWIKFYSPSEVANESTIEPNAQQPIRIRTGAA